MNRSINDLNKSYKVGKESFLLFGDENCGLQYNITKLSEILMDHRHEVILKSLKAINKNALIRFRDLCNTIIEGKE